MNWCNTGLSPKLFMGPHIQQRKTTEENERRKNTDTARNGRKNNVRRSCPRGAGNPVSPIRNIAGKKEKTASVWTI